MAYVTVPKDLTKIKSKVMFNLTKRQLLCFGAAVAIGLPLFFLTKDSAGTTTAALCMVLAMLPMFLLAILVILNFKDTLGVMSSISTGYMSCFFNFWKLSSLITCSIRQASASAVFGSTPAAIRHSVKKRCFS